MRGPNEHTDVFVPCTGNDNIGKGFDPAKLPLEAKLGIDPTEHLTN